MKRRVAIAQLSHETNVFSSSLTDLGAFHAAGLRFGDDIIATETDANTCIGGFIKAGQEEDFAIVPILSVWATPSGIVTAEAIETLLAQLCSGLESAMPLDGVLLALHGAMVTEIDVDGDARILERVRHSIGPETALVATIDLHANVSERMLSAPDLLIGFNTYPHTDMADRGLQAGQLLARLMERSINPVVAMIKPPMLPTSQRMTTDQEPMRSLQAMARRAELRPEVIDVTIAGGFPAADTEDAGVSVLVTTDDNAQVAYTCADEIASELWRCRDGFLGGVDSVSTAMSAVRRRQQGSPPLLIVDIGDNPWSGGPGDSAELLRLFLAWKVSNAAIALICDPESVRDAISAGVGNRVNVTLGGKSDDLHGAPLRVTGTVRMLSDGRYHNEGPMMAGLAVDIGPSAVIDVDDVLVLVTSRAESPIDLNVFRRHGIEPARLDLIGLKGKGHFRAAFEPIVSRVILIEGPGITGADLSRLPFQNVRRPIWPLDLQLEWS